MKILINKTNDVTEFYNICTRYSGDIDVSSDKYVVDGKSVLGLFSLALDKPVEVRINTPNKNEEETFYAEICKFIA